MEREENQNHAGRRFRLLKRIGKGGFGEVYLTELSTPTGFTKTVAIKLLREDIQGKQDTAQRMRDEARLLGMLRHRSIVQADDLIVLAGRTAVVMEFIPGVNQSWIIHPKRFSEAIPPRVNLTIIGHIADALDAAYNRPSTVTGEPLQVLHRDIKPGNVRITPDGEVKVLDFGIARSDNMNREATTTEYQLGSLPYMAPELMAGNNASTASDIYSLGVTFFESLARRRFGWAGDSPEAHELQIETRFKDIDWDPYEEASDGTRELLRSMLAFEPSQRPTARSVLETCRELEHKAPGVSLMGWAPDALPKIKTPEDSDDETGELIGQVLFEDVSTSAVDRQDLMDQLDDATQALSNAELRRAREAVGALNTPPNRAAALRDRLILVLLLFTTIAVAYMVKASEDDPTPAEEIRRTAQVQEAPSQAELTGDDPSVANEAADNLEPGEATEAAEAADPEPATVSEARPAQAAAAPTIEAPAPRPAPADPPVSADPVSVKFNSQPFGIPVFVDGVNIGKTPIQNYPIEPGEHTVMFQDGEHSIRQQIVVSPSGKSSWKYFQAEQRIR